METIIDQLKERFEVIIPDSIRSSPNAPGYITFSREKEGMMVFVFDLAFSQSIPRLMIATVRENWRVALDLMPDEMITFPAMSWSEFELKTRSLAQQNKT